MRNKLLLVAILVFSFTLSISAQDGPPPMPEITGDIIVEGLTSPQGLYIASDGALWVVDSGLGGDEEIEFVDATTFEPVTATFGQTGRLLRVMDGEQEVVAQLPSVGVGQDFISGARAIEIDGAAYLSVGVWHFSMGDDVTIPAFGTVSKIVDGELEPIADLWAHEAANNPDGSDNIETHPYDMAVDADGMLYVADAAANALLRVNIEDGTVETVAAFDPLPGVFPNQWRNGELLTDAVPTGVALAEDGSIYVGFLSGAPFIPGSASVMQVSAEGEVTPFAAGLTMLTDLTMGADGNLYATSFGMFTQEGPVFNSGMVLRILEDGTAEVIIEGLPFVTAIAIDADGNGYVAINGAGIPNAGMIVYYEGLTAMEGHALEMPAQG